MCSDRPQGSIELLVSATTPSRPVSINQWHIPLDDGAGDIWATFITVLIEVASTDSNYDKMGQSRLVWYFMMLHIHMLVWLQQERQNKSIKC